MGRSEKLKPHAERERERQSERKGRERDKTTRDKLK